MCSDITIQVSIKRHHLHFEVMEPVVGLSILGICPAIPVGVKKTFVASILKGKPVHFLWTFDMHPHNPSCLMGEEVRASQRLAAVSLLVSEMLTALCPPSLRSR